VSDEDEGRWDGKRKGGGVVKQDAGEGCVGVRLCFVAVLVLLLCKPLCGHNMNGK